MGWYRRFPYPGYGPWSYLPPWERPGWVFGRGWCWWFRPYVVPTLSKEDQIRYLEELKKYITDVVLKEIDKRLEALKGA